MQHEVELKLDLDSASADAIEASGLHRRASTTERLHSRHFDTPDCALRSAGLSLRLRESDGEWIQTVKADGGASTGLFDRAEWEIAVPGVKIIEDLRTPIASLLGHRISELIELFTVSVERKTWRIKTARGDVAMMLDRCEVRSAERSEQFCELELELIHGDPAALFGLAKGLGAVAPVRIGVLSKAARGYRLRAPQQISFKNKAPKLAPDEDLTSAIAAITQACITHYRRNEAILLSAQSVEAVHQARIALRRLRSALSLFRAVLPLNQVRMFQTRLRALAATLGEARDLDVMSASAEPGPMAQRLAVARDEAYIRLEGALAGKETRRLMLDLTDWLFCGTWRLDLASAASREMSPFHFAGNALDRAYRKVRKHSKHLARLAPEARHELRKDAKKLRYAIEFLASLYPSREQTRQRKRSVAAITALLDSLGALNDREVAEATLARLGLDSSVSAEGLLAHWNQSRLLQDAEDDRVQMFDLKPFWR